MERAKWIVGENISWSTKWEQAGHAPNEQFGEAFLNNTVARQATIRDTGTRDLERQAPKAELSELLHDLDADVMTEVLRSSIGSDEFAQGLKEILFQYVNADLAQKREVERYLNGILKFSIGFGCEDSLALTAAVEELSSDLTSIGKALKNIALFYLCDFHTLNYQKSRSALVIFARGFLEEMKSGQPTRFGSECPSTPRKDLDAALGIIAEQAIQNRGATEFSSLDDKGIELTILRNPAFEPLRALLFSGSAQKAVKTASFPLYTSRRWKRAEILITAGLVLLTEESNPELDLGEIYEIAARVSGIYPICALASRLLETNGQPKPSQFWTDEIHRCGYGIGTVQGLCPMCGR